MLEQVNRDRKSKISSPYPQLDAPTKAGAGGLHSMWMPKSLTSLISQTPVSSDCLYHYIYTTVTS